MTLGTIAQRYALDLQAKSPIEISGIGRLELAKLFHALGFRRGAEIGVEQGAYSEELCLHNPGVELVCVDAWRAYRGYREHVSQEKLDAFYSFTCQRLARFHCDIRRGWSLDMARTIPDGSLDFVYLDSNHTLPSVIQDLAAWLPKVREGGIISGHDYCRRKQNGYQGHVVEAVQAWTKSYHVEPWFVLGAKETMPGVVRDRSRSWMWVV